MVHDETSPLALGSLLVSDPGSVPIYGYHKLNKEKKAEIIKSLIAVYCKYFSEDPQDGTCFDIFVIESLQNILRHDEHQTGRKR